MLAAEVANAAGLRGGELGQGVGAGDVRELEVGEVLQGVRGPDKGAVTAGADDGVAVVADAGGKARYFAAEYAEVGHAGGGCPAKGAVGAIGYGGVAHYYRAIGTLFDPNFLGLMLVLTIIVLLTLKTPFRYLLQGIVGIYKYPLGVGVGNYKIITLDRTTNIFRATSFSPMAHNIIIEIISGLGIFAISFIFWLVEVINYVFKKNNNNNNLWAAVFLGLSINFLFDFTYFIPTMVWLWLISLGFALSVHKS